MKQILFSTQDLTDFTKIGGGKALHLATMTQANLQVPNWFCITANAYQEFVDILGNSIQRQKNESLGDFSARIEKTFISTQVPSSVQSAITTALRETRLEGEWLAVRSSGLDEDSKEHSFAGQFSSFLFVRGPDEILLALKKCWASAYSERGLAYRLENGLKTSGIQMGVVVQKMVNAKIAGVAFTQNPICVTDRENLVISSVWGLGEGLVSGELDADHYVVNRESGKIHAEIANKGKQIVPAAEGGIVKADVAPALREVSSLTDSQISSLRELCLRVEKHYGASQDLEWAIDDAGLYLVQTRPITTLPHPEIFNAAVNGAKPILWDNSNIIESYSGVTSPLTFSFASYAYRQVYIQFCQVVGVPQSVIDAHEAMYRNMLGILRGQIYYNLINWYRLVLMLPGSSNNKEFMETMMGVKQHLKPEYTNLFEFTKNPPQYSAAAKIKLIGKTFLSFVKIDSIVENFMRDFHAVYENVRKKDFAHTPLTDLAEIYQGLEDKILKKWQPPIINDYLCMLFFGLLKKLTAKWVQVDADKSALQNDLLCGQGNLESTEPTKMLMRIAAAIDTQHPAERAWLLGTEAEVVAKQMISEKSDTFLAKQLAVFLDRYGFRCINELKLEESDLHDDPSFVIHSIASYVKTKSYDLSHMEHRETEIRVNAEKIVNKTASFWQKPIYFWVLKHARKAVRNRENLRFARTKIFGVARHIFRGMGTQLTHMGVLDDSRDVFYLTVDELIAFVEGRTVTVNLRGLVALRRTEYEDYRAKNLPPERLMTIGAVGAALSFPQLLQDWDILSKDLPKSDDPNVLYGTPCCPGIVEGEVRVVKGVEDAKDLAGHILVTERTDPGWVPLYPSCTGLLIERGSLLSHSAVVARELGLPTIVGVNGGLVKKLKTGMRVRVDAGKGEIRILQ